MVADVLWVAVVDWLVEVRTMGVLDVGGRFLLVDLWQAGWVLLVHVFCRWCVCAVVTGAGAVQLLWHRLIWVS